MSSLTVSLRFDRAFNFDITEFQINLVPSSKPFYAAFLRTYYFCWEGLPWAAQCCRNNQRFFEPANMITKCDPRHGKYMTCSMIYRGDVVPKNPNAAIIKIKTKKQSNLLIGAQKVLRWVLIIRLLQLCQVKISQSHEHAFMISKRSAIASFSTASIINSTSCIPRELLCICLLGRVCKNENFLRLGRI